MIVEDEPFILDGLNNYDWSSLGIQVCETCGNGYLALMKLENSSIDIILTDIHMPIMNGLQLIEQVHRKYPHISIVVLSGYGNFEYVRASFKNNVSEYLLKPLKDDEIKKAFNTLVDKMNTEQQQLLKQETLEKNTRFAVKFFKSQFLNKILSYSMEKEEINEGSAYGEFIFESSMYSVCVFIPDNYELLNKMTKEDHDLVLFTFGKIFEEFCYEKELGYTFINPENYECYILFTNVDMQNNEELLRKVINELQKRKFKKAYR